MSTFQLRSVDQAQEALQLGQILTQCFNSSIEDWQNYTQQLGIENLRILNQGTQPVGGLAVYPMGQWFGGQRVPIRGLAAVGIAPECRGTGAAAALLTQMLEELQGQGIPLATLYASTVRLYRRVGFELAGTRCRFRVPTQTLVADDGHWRNLSTGHKPVGDHRTLPMTAIESCIQPLIADLYHQQALRTNGHLDRHPALWEQLFDATKATVFTYKIGDQEVTSQKVLVGTKLWP